VSCHHKLHVPVSGLPDGAIFYLLRPAQRRLAKNWDISIYTAWLLHGSTAS